MLLMDRIARESKINPCAKWLTNVGPVVERASKFVLGESFAIAADALTAEQVENVRDFLRIPFQTTWIEVAHNHRPFFAGANTELRPTEMVPERIGILFEAISEEMNFFRMSLFFSFPQRVVSWAPFHVGTSCYSIAFASDKTALADLRARMAIHTGLDPIKAKATTEDKITFLPNIYFAEDASKITDQETQDRIVNGGISDWQGEGLFWLAVLGLLNCRNAVRITEVDNKELNKKRRRLGRDPLTDHHVCNITLGKSHDEARHVSSPEEEKQIIRAHFVRGHFKVRKTGIFWWSPYVRGDLSKGFASKDYQVRTVQ
jgi:hypothetical protein